MSNHLRVVADYENIADSALDSLDDMRRIELMQMKISLVIFNK